VAFPDLVPGTNSTGFLAGASSSGSVTLNATPTAGNLLVFGIAGDKDIGTLTVASGAFSLPINLRSTSVSLALGLKVADGTETSVAVTITTGNPGGSQMWCGEFAESGNPNIWTIRGQATNNTDESPQTVWSSGTTGATTGDGLAIGIWDVDSVGTVGAFTYTNSFTGMAAPGSGGAEAGLWMAKKQAPRGATYESTLDRVGSTADQMSGGIIVIGRAPVTPVSVVGSYNSYF
jgi:nitrate reductase NapE component